MYPQLVITLSSKTMKIKNYITLAVLFIFFTSCEEVIQVDLETATPKLVIDASIQWEKGTTGSVQKIKLSTTTGYFDTEIPTVSGATITVTNSNGTVFNFIESNTPGSYICTNFIPVLNQQYTLTVAHNNQIYSATETLNPVPEIETIEQDNEAGFTGTDIEIKAFFTDNGTTNDYYLFQFQPNQDKIPSYDVNYDRFFQGNTFFSLYSSDKLKPGDELSIKIYGISQRYYNYMNILLSVAGSNQGSPFQSPPATVRGNIVNQINSSDYPLGYFNLSEMDSQTYIIQ